ncbi:MAG: TatD family hydrolase [Propionibacteriaceae bacterium]|jgi:TatD DNase family protein|nr:TatD family hydrolase [Propionibacteriaceae bacterium]
MSKKERDRSIPVVEALPVPMPDAHTHLETTREFSGLTTGDLLELARAANVTRLVDVGDNVAASRQALREAETHPEIIAAVAIHPNDAARLGGALDEQLFELGDLAMSSERIRAIGETGLDFYRTGEEGRPAQYRAFAFHIELAKQTGLPLMIHERDAHRETLQALDDEGAPEKVMMHCFSGDAEFARECAKRGYWLSFAGNVTYKANQFLAEALEATPVEQLLAETDAPFLTPEPYRGRVNASALLPNTVRFMAERKGVPLYEFCEILTANNERLYGQW